MRTILLKITDWVSKWESALVVSGWWGTKTLKIFSSLKKFFIKITYDKKD